MAIAQLRRVLASGALVLAGLLGYSGTAWLATQHSMPSAGTTAALTATTMAKVSTNWTDLTCHGLESYERHHDATSLYRMTVYAAHLGRGYLKSDVLEVASDAASTSKNAAHYLSVAEQYAGEDCWGGA